MLNSMRQTPRKYEQLALEALYLEEQLAQLVLTKLQLQPEDLGPGRWTLWDLEDSIDTTGKCKQLSYELEATYNNNSLTKIQKYQQILFIMKQKQELLERTIIGPLPIHYDNLYLYDIVHSEHGLYSDRKAN